MLIDESAALWISGAVDWKNTLKGGVSKSTPLLFSRLQKYFPGCVTMIVLVVAPVLHK